MARKRERDHVDRSTGTGHRPIWPLYYENKPREHVIATLQRLRDTRTPEQYSIVWQDGTTSMVVTTYKEFLASILSRPQNVDCYCFDLNQHETGFPWLSEAMEDAHVQVHLDASNYITSITIRYGNRWCSIVDLTSWTDHWDTYPGGISAILEDVITVGKDTGAGIHHSPGSLGKAIQWRSWFDHGSRNRITIPPEHFLETLRKHNPGGRAELFCPGENFEVAWELDLRSAYASCCMDVPCGTTVVLGGKFGCRSDADRNPYTWFQKLPTFFARCVVRMDHDFPLSPIPMHRVQGRRQRWHYPTASGTYGFHPATEWDEVWAWSHDIYAALRLGMDVEIEEGFGWPSTTDQLQPWVKEMEEYRAGYELQGEMGKASLIKSSLVAAIGRMGCGPVRRSLVSDLHAKLDDVPLVHRRGGAPIRCQWVHTESWSRSSVPIHIHDYIKMLCRLRLYDRQLQEMQDSNRIIGTNFDAIYTTHPSRNPTGNEMGSWRQNQLHNLVFKYSRGIVCDEKQTLPGVARKLREAAGVEG